MQKEIIFFDLDDTLLVEEASVEDAFTQTVSILARYETDLVAFVRTVRKKARELWYALPTHPYCKKIGISSWEGLWANFKGEGPDLEKLREMKDQYRLDAWGNALREYGLPADELAPILSDRFNRERRKRHVLFPESKAVLERLSECYRLGLVTNGTSDIQWNKINGGGLKPFFERIVISGEAGIAKPNKEIFQQALDFFGVVGDACIMIGNSLERDIGGAQAAGIASVWINRDGKPNDGVIEPDYTIRNLKEIYTILGIE